MPDLQQILGTMLATGMGGRSGLGIDAMGPMLGRTGFGSAVSGDDPAGDRGRSGLAVGSAAGLGALAYLAFKAFQERQRNQAGVGDQGMPPSGQPAGSPGGGQAGGGILGSIFGGGGLGSVLGGAQGGSLFERLSQVFQTRTGSQTTAGGDDAYPALAMEDQQTLLLIRAMITAANADGEISQDERRHILSALDEAGAGGEERRILEQELDRPQPLETLLQSVHDQQTAEQVYMASRMAVGQDSEAERSYLQYLASRLKIDPQRLQEIHRAA